VTATCGLAFTPTVGVVDRFHDHAADARAVALPAHASSLAPVHVRLLCVSDPDHGCAGALVFLPAVTGRYPPVDHAALLRHQLHGGARGAGELRAGAGPQLDRVDRRTHGDVAQRQVVARLDVGPGAVLHAAALRQAGGRQDVALLAVHVVQQRDA